MTHDYLYDIHAVQSQPILDVLRDCGGFYSCPKDLNGKRLGPLVGYAGRYEHRHQDSFLAAGEPTGIRVETKQYVGDIYCNFAKAEPYSAVRTAWARTLANSVIKRIEARGSREHWSIPEYSDRVVCLAAPMGGILLASSIAYILNCRAIFAENRVIQQATATSREVSELDLVRHEIEPGRLVWIVEDVCNNFSTTEKLITLVNSRGSEVVGILSMLNRSGKTTYMPKAPDLAARPLPVYSLVNMEIPQYKQDDPYVAEDIRKGNVVWKPKNDWERLAKAMDLA